MFQCNIKFDVKVENKKSYVVVVVQLIINVFMDGFLVYIIGVNDFYLSDDKMFIENGDVIFWFLNSVFVDLFSEFEEVIDSNCFDSIFIVVWVEDFFVIFKIIFNVWLIYFGKSLCIFFYWCVGWLVEYYFFILVSNIYLFSSFVILKLMLVKK